MAKSNRNSFSSAFEELGDVNFDKQPKGETKKDEGKVQDEKQPSEPGDQEPVIPGKSNEAKMEGAVDPGADQVIVNPSNNEKGRAHSEEEFAAIFLKRVPQGKIAIGTQITSDHAKMLDKMLMAFPVKKYELLCNIIENFYNENVKLINKEISKKLKI